MFLVVFVCLKAAATDGQNVWIWVLEGRMRYAPAIAGTMIYLILVIIMILKRQDVL